MRILVDVDNTLCDNMGWWLHYYNRKSGDALCPDDIVSWDIESYLKPEWIPYFWEVAYPRSFQEAKPFPDAKDVLANLKSGGHEILYVTAGVCVAKMEWLFDWRFSEGKVALAPKNVATIYNKNWIIGDVLIDDGLHNFLCSSKKNILFDQPWNQDGDYCRVKSWKEVKEHIDKMSNKTTDLMFH